MTPPSTIENPFKNPNLKTLAIIIPVCDTTHSLLTFLANKGHIGVHTTTGQSIAKHGRSFILLRYKADDPTDISRWAEAMHYVTETIEDVPLNRIFG